MTHSSWQCLVQRRLVDVQEPTSNFKPCTTILRCFKGPLGPKDSAVKQRSCKITWCRSCSQCTYQTHQAGKNVLGKKQKRRSAVNLFSQHHCSGSFPWVQWPCLQLLAAKRLTDPRMPESMQEATKNITKIHNTIVVVRTCCVAGKIS